MNEHRVSQLLDEARYFEDHRMWLHAVQIYQRLLEAYPEELDFRVRLGVVYLEMGNLKAAEQVLLQAIRYDARNPDILYSLGVICYQSKDYDRALFYLQQLAGKRLPKAHYSLGLVHWQRGEWEHAARHFKLTLQLQPDHFDAALALGETCLRNGDAKAAIAALRNAATIAPDSASVYHLLGSAYAGSGAWADAAQAFEQAVEIEPENPELLLGLAAARMSNRDFDEAERLYKSLLLRQQRIEDALLGLGRIALMKSQLVRAKEYFSKILEINPEHEAALEHVQYLAPHGRPVS